MKALKPYQLVDPAHWKVPQGAFDQVTKVRIAAAECTSSTDNYRVTQAIHAKASYQNLSRKYLLYFMSLG